MGLLSWLKDQSDAVTSALASEVAKIKNKDAAYASLAIAALTAGADGEVEPEERKAIINFVKNSNLYAAFDRTELSKVLEGYFAKCTDELLREDLFDVINKVKGKDAATSVVRVGIGIANADGEFESEEKDILTDVVNRLGLDLRNFKQLAA